jgi:hypothetical protein
MDDFPVAVQSWQADSCVLLPWFFYNVQQARLKKLEFGLRGVIPDRAGIWRGGDSA